MKQAAHLSLYVVATVFLVGVVFAMAVVVHAATTDILLPTADGGSDSAEWANETGAACNTISCTLSVNEATGASCGGTSDGDTTYITSTVNKAEQTFTLDLSSIPNNSVISAVTVTACSERVGAAAARFQPEVCINGSCVNVGMGVTGDATYATSTQSESVNVVKTAATNIEVGVVTANPNTIRVSQLATVFTYTPPTGGGGSVAPTRVLFTGRAYPGATVRLFRKSAIDEGYQQVPDAYSAISPTGEFETRLIALLGGEYVFVLQATDKDGRQSGIMSFGTDLLAYDKYLVGDLLFPPTVDIKSRVTRSEALAVAGYAAAGYGVELELDRVATASTTAGLDGRYSATFATTALSPGVHYVRARQTDKATGHRSDYSQSRAFLVSLLSYPKVDLNEDSRVDIADLSIFISLWSTPVKDPAHAKIDFNNDNKVDIADLSLFLQAMLQP